jgi:hypothetical protein
LHQIFVELRLNCRRPVINTADVRDSNEWCLSGNHSDGEHDERVAV